MSKKNRRTPHSRFSTHRNVVFQYLYDDGRPIGEYANIDNEYQTVTIVPVPIDPICPPQETTPTVPILKPEVPSQETTPAAPALPASPKVGPQTGDTNTAPHLIAAMLAALFVALLVGYALLRGCKETFESASPAILEACLKSSFEHYWGT